MSDETPDDWEAYDPCPDCGEDQQFKEMVKAYGKTTAADGDKLSFDLNHIGRAMHIECATCGLTLAKRPKEETPR